MMSVYVLATIALSTSKQWCGWEYEVEGRHGHTAFHEDITASSAMNCIESTLQQVLIQPRQFAPYTLDGVATSNKKDSLTSQLTLP